MAPARVLTMVAALDRVAANNLAEQAVLLVEQGQSARLELLEELCPGYLGKALVIGLPVVREHDADDPDVPTLMGALDSDWLAALQLGPMPDGVYLTVTASRILG
jgi:hypothetical protein